MIRQDWFFEARDALAPGYAILIPVPSDLPVFTELALRNLSKQNLENCLEIVVVPDQISKRSTKHLPHASLSSHSQRKCAWYT